jgi:hypothetical protein
MAWHMVWQHSPLASSWYGTIMVWHHHDIAPSWHGTIIDGVAAWGHGTIVWQQSLLVPQSLVP